MVWENIMDTHLRREEKADKEYMEHLKKEAIERGECAKSEILKGCVIIEDDLPF